MACPPMRESSESSVLLISVVFAARCANSLTSKAFPLVSPVAVKLARGTKSVFMYLLLLFTGKNAILKVGEKSVRVTDFSKRKRANRYERHNSQLRLYSPL